MRRRLLALFVLLVTAFVLLVSQGSSAAQKANPTLTPTSAAKAKPKPKKCKKGYVKKKGKCVKAKKAKAKPKPKPKPPPPPSGLTAAGPIDHFAAAGNRVVYSVCGHVFVWTLKAPAAVPIDGFAGTPCSSSELVPPIVSEVAIAGDRAVYETRSGGNVPSWALHGVILGSTLTPLSLPSGGGVCCAGTPLNGILGNLAGSGSLLVFTSWDTAWAGGVCCTGLIVKQQRIQRVGPAGCDCPVIETQPGPIVPFDGDAGRIVAGGDNATLLLDANGAKLQEFRIPAVDAALSGNDVTLLVHGRLLDYDAGTGALLHSWPVPDVSTGSRCSPSLCELRLQDAARGLVAFIISGQLHLLRLSDGADTTIGPAAFARFTSTGLAYATGSNIQTVAYASLPFG